MPSSDAVVDEKVRAAAALLRKLGAQVDEVSIPIHRVAPALLVPIIAWGITHTVFGGDGLGGGRRDLYVTSLMDRQRGWRLRADDLPPTVKTLMIFGKYLDHHCGSRYYGKAMNLVRVARSGYDEVLRVYDLLLLPTTPIVAKELPPEDASIEAYVQRSLEAVGNTVQFNLTHHPAMSVPCGMSDGLPVGMMLVGRHFSEAAIYRAAYALEQAYDWRTS